MLALEGALLVAAVFPGGTVIFVAIWFESAGLMREDLKKPAAIEYCGWICLVWTDVEVIIRQYGRPGSVGYAFQIQKDLSIPRRRSVRSPSYVRR